MATLLGTVALTSSSCSISISSSDTAPSLSSVESSSPDNGIPNDCKINVYAQNVWPATPPKPGQTYKSENLPQDYGALIRSGPGIEYAPVRGVKGNTPLEVKGWSEAKDNKPLFENNPSDRNGRYWLKIVNNGWANNAAVRAEPTTHDPFIWYGEDPSKAVPLDPRCEIK